MAESKTYRLHPEALQELEAADDWYLQRSVDASAAFIASVLDAFDTISQAPQRWPTYLHGTHRFVLDRFPCERRRLLAPRQGHPGKQFKSVNSMEHPRGGGLCALMPTSAVVGGNRRQWQFRGRGRRTGEKNRSSGLAGPPV